MSKKEAAIQFIGIFFCVCVCMYCVFPIAARVTSSAAGLQSLAGQQHREEEEKIRGGAGPAPRQRPECHPGRCKSSRCERQRHRGGGVHCNIFELFPATPAAGIASRSLHRKDSEGWAHTLRAAPVVPSISFFFKFNLLFSCVRAGAWLHRAFRAERSVGNCRKMLT